MQEIISKSEEETRLIAGNLAKKSKSRIFALTGNLGAGKTTFVQGFAKELGIKEKIISPTFILIRQHDIPNTTKTLYHIDLYRLDHVKNLGQLGLNEILSDPDNIVFIEWADRYDSLPTGTIRINITRLKNDRRLITID